MLDLLNASLEWLAAACALGLAVGYFTCTQGRPRGPGGQPSVQTLLGVGLGVALSHWLPGRENIWLETALLLIAAYVIGCCIGCFFHAAFQRPAPVRRTVSRAPPAYETTAATVAAKLYPPEPAADAHAQPSQKNEPNFLKKAAVVLPHVSDFAGFPLPVIKPRPAAEKPSPLAEKTAGKDEFRLIRGIGPAMAKKLCDLGVRRFVQIAGWTEDQARWIGNRLGCSDRIARENWILQARLLAAGVDTEFARAVKTGETSLPHCDKPLSEAEAEHLAAALPQPIRPQPSDELYAGVRPLGLLQSLRGENDDLTRIVGIDARTGDRLKGLGIWTFGQIACWTPENCRWIGSYLAFPGKIERENWLEQARGLMAETPPETQE